MRRGYGAPPRPYSSDAGDDGGDGGSAGSQGYGGTEVGDH
jgi:hypothetical protein